MKILKTEILSRIRAVVISGSWHVMDSPIDAQAINSALKLYGNVKIPYIGEPIVLSTPIVMSSDNHLRVDKRQVIMQDKSSHTCLVRNKNIQHGAKGNTDRLKRDRNISIEGGIWNIKTDERCYADEERQLVGSIGSIILSSVEQVSLKNMRIFDSEACGKGDNDASYGIQISDCSDFVIENIDFYDNSRDGVHINGPAEYGYIRHIRGEKMGDDMVALNAWDWKESALTFGTIEKIVVEDVKGPGNEVRLLPGQKVFDSGERVDCDIKDCIFEKLEGIYTFKMYAQPNILNAEQGAHDVSGSVGNIRNVFFKDISFAKVTPAGFHGLPVKSLFEICADCENLYIENAVISNTLEECINMDICLINVGPLSAVWKNGSENPEDWGEVYDPDAICTVDNLYLKNIFFHGELIREKENLVREVVMKINPDYPRTIPRGGTGYGNIKRVFSL